MLTEEQILWDVVEEHLDEAEFLAEQWHAARRSPDYTLEELRDGPERRLMAHVDGLVVNGAVALEQVAWPVVREGGEPPRVAAAALALLQAGDFAVLTVLDEEAVEEDADDDDEPEADPEDEMPAELEALAQQALDEAARNPPPLEDDEVADDDADDSDEDESEDEQAETPPPSEDVAANEDPRVVGLSLALALSDHPDLGDRIRTALAKAKGPTATLLLGACADRGLDPGTAIDTPITQQDDLPLLVAALRAAAGSNKQRLLGAVEGYLQHPTPAVRLAALETAMRWGSTNAWQVASHAYKQPHGRSAMAWVAVLGDDRHATALVPLLGDESLRPHALWALGLSGRVPAVLACLPLLDHDDELTRRLAGEAITAIVGLDLDDESLWEEADLDAEAEGDGIGGDDPGDDEDDLEAELATTPEDDLPLPNAEAIRNWWDENRERFSEGGRYLLGKSVGREGPGWALKQLSCRRVDAVATEIVGRSQGVGRWPGRTAAQPQLDAAGRLATLGGQAGALRGR